MIRSAREITVALENRRGRLAHLCKCLAERKVNIMAISVVDSATMGLVRLVVDKPEVALEMLQTCPMTVTEREVLLVDLPNRAGALAEAADRLAKRRINIEYVYGSARGRGAALLVVAAPNLKRAREALEEA